MVKILKYFNTLEFDILSKADFAKPLIYTKKIYIMI